MADAQTELESLHQRILNHELDQEDWKRAMISLDEKTRDISCRMDKQTTKTLVDVMKLFTEFSGAGASLADVVAHPPTRKEKWFIGHIRSLLMPQHDMPDQELVESVMSQFGISMVQFSDAYMEELFEALRRALADIGNDNIKYEDIRDNANALFQIAASLEKALS
ncbi:hypothetical protein SmJEL517_g03108 [Synchytrium microbalum]|uniref:Uncharacterized protein n=1 Tax=Synchytrium microbalum TaxID=1806994 RepID=A0A507BZH8_9FUNG|nr:uncharacterized protein SmJEL517_g03108 [Synchytrium microbalum]TPX34207.1 hypothetical protein SmJEL517_g03108 [Synchytrium microbalum]